ncbi:MAG: DNA translocase FtsK 4TM domain-containing protein [Campylobacteraceae bacterium]
MILSIALLVFLGISTILPDSSIVGVYGKTIGEFNVRTFGYLAYVYPFVLIIPCFLFYQDPKVTIRKVEVILAGMLLFFSALMFQASVISPTSLNGHLGYSVVDTLSAFIGTLGIWIFIIAIGFLSICILFNFGIDDFIAAYNSFFDERENKKDKIMESKLETPSYMRRSFRKKASKDKVSAEEEIEKAFKTKENSTPFFIEEINNTQEEGDPKVVINSKTNKTENKKTSFDDDDDAGEDIKENTNLNVEILSEVAENKRLLSQIEQGKIEKPKDYKLPPISFLVDTPKRHAQINEAEIDRKISDLLEKLRRFKIDGDVIRTYAGPVVTTFEFKPAPYVKVSKILTLQDDLAMALMAQTIRIQAPIPGKDVVGIEIPNKNIETIYLKEILESDIFNKSSSPLTIALGKDIVGNPFVTDLKKLPHLLIAGTTGSGKSVGINAMLVSLLYRNSPDTLRLMMIDPKMLEFSIYNDIPHLLTPVITQAKQAIIALSNMVSEMERRYQIMARTKTKNIESYNEKVKSDKSAEPFPYIVVIIDELADLMMTSGKDVEVYIARLAQMARASGIHLVVATQRPSVDVVTGLIKANLPSRISYKVGQRIDSKVILDMQGAESLLGRGDMLFTPPGTSGVIRLHAPFTSEKEIEKLVDYLKMQRPTNYDESFLKDSNGSGNGNSSYSNDNDFDNGEIDELFEDAKRIVLTEQKTSISYIQRRLQIGYNRAARIIEQLENMGVLSAPNSKGQRDIL